MARPKNNRPPKKGAGGKLNRSEIVQTRLSPRLRFYAEIMARDQRRSLSSLIENLLERAAVDYKISTVIAENQTNNPLSAERNYKEVMLRSLTLRIWVPEETDRFVRMAFYTPHLLTPEEERVWQMIVERPYFWDTADIQIKSDTGEVIGTKKVPFIDYRGLIHERLRKYWFLIADILEGKEPIETLKILKLPEEE